MGGSGILGMGENGVIGIITITRDVGIRSSILEIARSTKLE